MKKPFFYTLTAITIALLAFYLVVFRFPDKTWVLDDPTASQTMNAKVFLTNMSWCGEFTYSNDEDCEFLLLVTAKTDTLFYYPIKALADRKEKRYKYKNFTLNYHKKLTIKYIPVRVKKNTRIVLNFSNSMACKN